MSVWLCLPSKRSAEETQPLFHLWHERGYKIAIQRDEEEVRTTATDLVIWRPYHGYAEAVNYLVKQVLAFDSTCDWVACAGDDTEPDPNHTAEEIAIQCKMHFYNHLLPAEGPPQPLRPQGSNLWTETFGVMQPTGDRWGDHPDKTHAFSPRTSGRTELCVYCGHPFDNHRHSTGALIDRVAGSPWMGRSFCERVNGGRGPLWPEYTHQFVDQELQEVAIKLGVFWQRPDLIHFHRHWGRGENGKLVDAATMPEFLREANSQAHWDKFKKLFYDRQAAGFPGHECL
jgi:hypothetical protein